MAWSIVGVGTSVEVTATAHALTVPAGVAAGDLLVACIASRIASTTSITLPTGGEWTLVGEQKANNILTTGSAVASAMMAYCVRGASDPNLTFTHPAAPAPALGRIVAYRGGATPTASAKDTQTSSTTAISITAVNLAGLTTTVANDLIVAMLAGGQEAAWSSFNATTPSGASGATDTTTAPSTTTWIERADVQTTTSNDTSLGIFDAVKTAAGATGNFTATASVAASHALVAGAFKILTLVNRTITADAGSYALTGTAATLTKAGPPIDRQYAIGGPIGAAYVSETGTRQYSILPAYVAETITLPAVGTVLSAVAGSYALTGTVATLKLARLITATAGSYALTGQPASLELGKEVLALAGSYSLTGTAVTLLHGWKTAAVNGTYTLTGTPANLLKPGAYAIIGLPGSYTLTGAATSLELGREVLATGGSYALTGQPATLSKTTAGAYVLVASPGTYTLTGSPASLIWSGEEITPPGSGQRDGDAGLRPKRRPKIFHIIIEEARKLVERPIPLRKKRKKLAKLIAEEVLPEVGGLLAADKLLLELMIRRQLEQIPLTQMHTEGWYQLQDQLLEVITDAEQTAQLLRAEAEEEDDLLLLLIS